MILKVMEVTLSFILGETWCSNCEGILSESKSVSVEMIVTRNLHHHWQRKDEALLMDRVQQVLLSTAESQLWQLTTLGFLHHQLCNNH